MVVMLALSGISLGQEIPGVNVSQPLDTATANIVTLGISGGLSNTITSLIDTALDTGYFRIEAWGTAKMSENEVLYLGITDTTFTRDTITIRAPDNMEGYIWIPWYLSWISVTGAKTEPIIDTFYLYGATGDSSYAVELIDVKLQVSLVYDNN